MKLRRGLGFAVLVASAPSQLTAQTETIDLSGHALETVIPAEFDGPDGPQRIAGRGYIRPVGHGLVRDAASTTKAS